MKIKSVVCFVILSFVFAGFVRCEREQGDCGDRILPVEGSLTVAEAREFFESAGSGSETRSGAESPMPFVVGAASLKWDEAEASSLPYLECVDVPIDAEYAYYVAREDAAGNRYDVRADSKIIVVRSENSDRLATYVRTAIPDREYADIFYDQNICDLTLNCDDRVDYCGLEYYSTLDGRPIAVARYEYGVCTSSVFLYDSDIPAGYRAYRFGRLMGGMRIVRRPADAETRASGEWDYGAPGTTFISDNGTVYVYLDTDGDGKSDSVTTYDLYLEMISGESGGGGGGSSGSSGSSGNSGGYGGDGSYGGSNSGNSGSSGNGGVGAGAGSSSGSSGGSGSSSGSGSSGGSGNSGGSGDSGGDSYGNLDGNNVLDGDDNPDKIELDKLFPNPPNPLPGEKVDKFIPNDTIPNDTVCPKCGKNPCICINKEDCENVAPTASENAYEMTALHSQVTAEANYESFLDSVARRSDIEYGTTGYGDASSGFHLMEPYTDNRTNSVDVRLAKPECYENITMVHNHPRSTPCSVEDVYALTKLGLRYIKFRSIFVYTTTGMEYVIYIYDIDMLTEFAKSEMYDKMKLYFKDVFYYLRESGHDYNTAHLYALANMLSRLNTGIAILSKSGNESMFHQHEAPITGFDDCDNPLGFYLVQCKPVTAQTSNRIF